MTKTNYFIKNFFKKLAVMKTLPIFAPELTLQPSFKAFIVAAFFISANQNSTGCCFSTGSCYKALLTVPKSQREQQSFFINLIFNPTMQPSIKNESSVNNSNLLSTSAHETCKLFIKLIRKQYPQLNRVRYKLHTNFGKEVFCFRAKYEKRQLYSVGYTAELAMSHFMFQIYRKCFYEEYFPDKLYKWLPTDIDVKIIDLFYVRKYSEFDKMHAFKMALMVEKNETKGGES